MSATSTLHPFSFLSPVQKSRPSFRDTPPSCRVASRLYPFLTPPSPHLHEIRSFHPKQPKAPGSYPQSLIVVIFCHASRLLWPPTPHSTVTVSSVTVTLTVRAAAKAYCPCNWRIGRTPVPAQAEGAATGELPAVNQKTTSTRQIPRGQEHGLADNRCHAHP
ncbi:hypothetical protein BaRGS_00032387 [Batillaria attramentaria]|uniref:Uncharacterized protein n=1 Tax=Batillaria attramentaria TaxID=370345 RepID=A0ABD0JPJ2_9CAEN